jgi:hypothetical protein
MDFSIYFFFSNLNFQTYYFGYMSSSSFGSGSLSFLYWLDMLNELVISFIIMYDFYVLSDALN